MRTEVWARDKKWRMITLHTRTQSLQYSWGAYDYPVQHFMRMFGGSLKAAMDGAHGAGSERWYSDLDIDTAKKRLATLRKSAEKAGFAKLGEF